ncbi:hypothetical protein ACOI1C_17940 [Bacillus sp. DJP31]|uniref:hypothetical protein n=1 Tax=Bacillus sp. DJP31 TaxID=3409789 RepID=UPI003BB78FE1
MKNKKIFLLFLIVAILFCGLYATTYFPKRIITIDPSDVSKIEIFDGNRGDLLTVTLPNEVEHIVSNINSITFKKGKFSFGYSGYKFRLTLYDNAGKEHKEIIINSSEKIRYNGFFYTDELSSIDYDYIDGLFKGN